MKKKLMIFGAGINQGSLIDVANRMDITTITIDPDPNAINKNKSDFHYLVGGDDYKQTKEIALKHNIDGIATTQMENPLRLMAKLGEELHLNFNSFSIIDQSLDKWKMKKCFLANNIPCANGIIFKQKEKIQKNKIDRFQFPLIIKPLNGTSSQGVMKIENFNMLQKYEDMVRSFSNNNEILVEEFLDGPELSLECVTFKGETKIIQYTEKFITPYPHPVEIGHLQPAKLSIKDRNQIDMVVKNAIKCLGLDNTVTHPEVKMTKNGIKMVEIGPRGGGDFISSYLTLGSTGIDLDAAIVKLAFGEQPNLNKKSNKFSFIKYLELPIGNKIRRVNDFSDLMKNSNVILADISIKRGEIVEKISQSKKRPGFVIVRANSKKELIKMAEKYLDILAKRIEKE